MQSDSSPNHWLEAEYLLRRKKNPRYSLRAFSQLLDLPSGRVSQLLSRKRNFTPKLGEKIATQLSFDPQRTQEFLSLIASEKNLRRKGDVLPPPAGSYAPLDMDQFEAIANPAHFSILSLIETKNFPGTIKSVARRLGLDVIEARAAVERLERLGLVHFEKGKLKLSRTPGLTTTHDVQSKALRHAHKKVLEESIAALEEVALELRDITSITMPTDPRKLMEAKKRIRDFRRSLCEFVDSGRQTEVYRLNIQFIPVTKKD